MSKSFLAVILRLQIQSVAALNFNTPRASSYYQHVLVFSVQKITKVSDQNTELTGNRSDKYF